MPRPAPRPGYDPDAWARRWARVAAAFLVVGFFVTGLFEHRDFLDATLAPVRLPPQNPLGVFGRTSANPASRAVDVLPLALGLGVLVASFLANRKSLGPVLLAVSALPFVGAAAVAWEGGRHDPPFSAQGFFLPMRDFPSLAWAQLAAASCVAAGVHAERHAPVFAGARLLARWGGVALLAVTSVASLPAVAGGGAPIPWPLVANDASMVSWRLAGVSLVGLYGALAVLGAFARVPARNRILAATQWLARGALCAYPIGGLMAAAMIVVPRGFVAEVENQAGFDLLYVGQTCLLPLGLAATLERRRHVAATRTVADVFA